MMEMSMSAQLALVVVVVVVVSVQYCQSGWWAILWVAELQSEAWTE
jgi:hypothetical protein